MLLLASALFLTLLQCSSAQNEGSFTPADCNTIETDAGVALDLVNKHRRDGYVFGLFRVADAHELHTGNSSVLYLTLDVLETECPVLSRKHWESCEYSDTYAMDFGQCKIITYTNHLLKKPQLYGFNCTLSPDDITIPVHQNIIMNIRTNVNLERMPIWAVPPDLLECKDCPVKIEVLEVMEQHKDIAAKALKKFKAESTHTKYFAVDKVERVLKMTGSREGHILGFSIKETNCSETVQQEDQALECDFLHDWHAHMGFCTARVISDAEEPDGTDISCEIYHPWQLGFGRRGKGGKPHRHPHFRHHFGHRHHHRHHHRHECPPSSQPRPEDPEHNHNFSKEDQDSHEGPAPPPPTPSHDEPGYPHPPHHHGPHCPPPHGPHCPPPPPPHGPHCPPPPPPPHGPDHPHPHHHHGRHCPPPPHGPHCPPPPPPPHGPHCPPPPPPPHGPHCPPPPPPPHGPHCPPPPPPPPGPDHPHPHHHHGPPPGHPPHHCHHHYRHHCNKTSMSGKYFPCHVTGTIYRIPVLNQQDTLTPPSANFSELSHSSTTGEGIAFTGSRLTDMPEDPGFSDHPTQSKSCPGKPKLVLPKILPLFPQSSMPEKSPI